MSKRLDLVVQNIVTKSIQQEEEKEDAAVSDASSAINRPASGHEKTSAAELRPLPALKAAPILIQESAMTSALDANLQKLCAQFTKITSQQQATDAALLMTTLVDMCGPAASNLVSSIHIDEIIAAWVLTDAELSMLGGAIYNVLSDKDTYMNFYQAHREQTEQIKAMLAKSNPAARGALISAELELDEKRRQATVAMSSTNGVIPVIAGATFVPAKGSAKPTELSKIAISAPKGTAIEYLNRKGKWIAGHIVSMAPDQPLHYVIINAYGLQVIFDVDSIRLVVGSEVLYAPLLENGGGMHVVFGTNHPVENENMVKDGKFLQRYERYTMQGGSVFRYELRFYDCLGLPIVDTFPDDIAWQAYDINDPLRRPGM
eukprot:gene27038-33699_t